jgi:transcriptional regulator with XRE-family HTH domain
MKQHDVLTEQELSANTGVPQPTINRILSGTTKVPRKAAMKALSAFFKVPLNSLIDLEGEPKDLNTSIDEPGTQVPLLQWDNLEDQSRRQHIISFKKLEGQLFALVVLGDELEPRFSKSSIMIFRKDKIPKNRDYILLPSKHLPVVKQILIDGNNYYAKSLDVELGCPIERLDVKQKILGVLVQSISEFGD